MVPVQPMLEDANIYHSGGYYHKARWMTFYYQYQNIFNFNGKRVLEIGPGGGITTAVLRQHGIEVTTADMDPAIKPDMVADVLDLPFSSEKFDTVVGFEILEHLPFTSFITALEEMKRVSSRYVFISVPDTGKSLLRLTFKVPFIKERDWQIRIPAMSIFKSSFGEKHWLPKGHYWEMGNSKYPYKKVAGEIEKAGLRIITSFVANDCPMTRFFFTEIV